MTETIVRLKSIMDQVVEGSLYGLELMATSSVLMSQLVQTGKVVLAYVQVADKSYVPTIKPLLVSKGLVAGTSLGLVDAPITSVPDLFQGRNVILVIDNPTVDVNEKLTLFSQSIVMAAVRVPKGTRMAPIYLYRTQYVSDGDYDIFISIPNNAMVPKKVFESFPHTIYAASGAIEQWHIKEKPVPIVGRVGQIGQVSKTIQHPSKDIKYLQGLQQFLFTTLSKLLGKSGLSSEQIQKMLIPEMMQVWAVAFTHESISRNPLLNYEILEFNGDLVMANAFGPFVTQKYVSHAKASDLKNIYLSKKFLADIADKLGFEPYIVHLVPDPIIMISLKEDAVESFFGALKQVADRAFKRGMGDILASYAVEYIFTEVMPIDPKFAGQNAITRIVEILRKIDWKENYTYDVGAQRGTLTVVVGKYATNFGLKEGQVLEWTADHYDSKTAKGEVYSKAYVVLTELGVTFEKISEMRQKYQFSHPEVRPLVTKILNHLRSEGIVSLRWDNIQLKTNGVFLQLTGIKNNGDEETVFILREPNSNIESWIHMMDEYVKSQGI